VHPDTGLKIDNTRQYTKNSFLKKQKIIFRGDWGRIKTQEVRI
jgi:hypothetical protein